MKQCYIRIATTKTLHNERQPQNKRTRMCEMREMKSKETKEKKKVSLSLPLIRTNITYIDSEVVK